MNCRGISASAYHGKLSLRCVREYVNVSRIGSDSYVQLESLNLSHNVLSGSVPAAALHHRSLVELILSKNHLTGCLPSSQPPPADAHGGESAAPPLRILALSDNLLRGSLQPLAHLVHLTDVRFRGAYVCMLSDGCFQVAICRNGFDEMWRSPLPDLRMFDARGTPLTKTVSAGAASSHPDILYLSS